MTQNVLTILFHERFFFSIFHLLAEPSQWHLFIGCNLIAWGHVAIYYQVNAAICFKFCCWPCSHPLKYSSRTLSSWVQFISALKSTIRCWLSETGNYIFHLLMGKVTQPFHDFLTTQVTGNSIFETPLEIKFNWSTLKICLLTSVIKKLEHFFWTGRITVFVHLQDSVRDDKLLSIWIFPFCWKGFSSVCVKNVICKVLLICGMQNSGVLH